VAAGEATVLQMMRRFDNKHLVKAIAYYQQEKDFYLIFPWAEFGDLWGFWTNDFWPNNLWTENPPTCEPNYIK
jgi:hypothetical protein